MKIDILMPVGEKGGVENVVNSVAQYMKKQGWEIRVIQLVWEGVEWVLEEIPFFPLLYGRAGHNLQEFAQAYSEFMNKHGAPDVTLATTWPYMCYVSKQAAFLSNVEFKVISWLHAPVERYVQAGYGGYESLEFADAHFAISDLIYQEIRKNCKKRLLYRVNNPVEMSQYSVRTTKNIDKKEKQCFFVGRISKEKRLEIIIRALSKVKNLWKLHIIGTGEEEYVNSLKELANREGVSEDIVWYGWKGNPWFYTENADALIIASEYEGFPMVAIEAQANGIPVISTPVSGIIELIKPGINGYLFPFGDYEALAEILKTVSSGLFSEISPSVCRNAVQTFKSEIALADFGSKLQETVLNYDMISKVGVVKNIQEQSARVSIIVSCYNVEKYLRECLDSILQQTFPLEQMEIILVNDASTDKTFDIMKEYEERFPEQMLLINLEKNVGQGAGRNIGMQYITGKYVMFVDSDDRLKSNILQSLFEKAELYSSDFAECGYSMFFEDTEIEKIEKEEYYYKLAECDERRKYILKWGSDNSVLAKLYRAKFIQANEIYFPENMYMEDSEFHQICMMTANSSVMLKNCLYECRYNSKSTNYVKS